MASHVDDNDDDDLYPPDVEHVTPEASHQRKRAIIGTGLVTLGCGLLLERLLGRDLDYFWLAVGVGLLAGWAQVRRYPTFAFGAIITGFGLGSFVESLLHVRFESALGTLIAAAGFLAVYVRYPRRAAWAIVPAGVMGIVTLADIGVGLVGLVLHPLSGLLLPLAVISAGALLLFRHSLPERFVKCGLVAAVILFVLAASSSAAHGGQLVTMSCGAKDIDVVRIHTTSGDVHLRTDAALTGPTLTSHVRRRHHGPPMFSNDNGAPTSAACFPFITSSSDVDLRVPRGTDIDVVTASGDVVGDVQGGRVDIMTTSGDVDLAVRPLTSETTDASFSIATTSGDVELDGHGFGEIHPALQLASTSGDISVDGKDHDDRLVHSEGSDDSIRVNTVSGDIDLAGV
jgi:hypothetical protein